MQLGIIGGGKVGSCLATYLQGSLVGITCATATKAMALAKKFALRPFTNEELCKEAKVILLTVPDRLIGQVAQELAASAVVENKVFLHCSGSLGLEPLAPLAAAGAHVGSLHPLQSFASSNTKLAGVYMAVDGDEEAQGAAQQLAELLGGKSFFVPAQERAAYHAAACICSNYAVAVEALAQQLMSRWMPNGSQEAAWQALLPLFQGTAANLQATAMPGSVLTGPIARGDVSTVKKHLAVLPAEMKSIYCSLGLVTAQVALSNGTITTETAAELKTLLQTMEV